MDCSYRNQQAGCASCQPMIQPAHQSGMAAGMSSAMPAQMPMQTPFFQQAQYFCPDTSPGGMEQYPVGMGYILWQQWQQTYPLERGFQRGTIFPDLDLPFMRGGCR